MSLETVALWEGSTWACRYCGTTGNTTENCEVEVVDSGHLRSDPKMKEEIQKNVKATAKK